jgi:hypothetical protein
MSRMVHDKSVGNQSQTDIYAQNIRKANEKITFLCNFYPNTA